MMSDLQPSLAQTPGGAPSGLAAWAGSGIRSGWVGRAGGADTTRHGDVLVRAVCRGEWSAERVRLATGGGAGMALVRRWVVARRRLCRVEGRPAQVAPARVVPGSDCPARVASGRGGFFLGG